MKVQSEQKWQDEIFMSFWIEFTATSSNFASINESLTIINYFFFYFFFFSSRLSIVDFRLFFYIKLHALTQLSFITISCSIDILCNLLFLRFLKMFTIVKSCQLKRFEFSIWNFHNALIILRFCWFSISSFRIVHSIFLEFHENTHINRARS